MVNSEDKAFVVDNNGWDPQRCDGKAGLIDFTQSHCGFYIMHCVETRQRESQKEAQGSCLFWMLVCIVYSVAAIDFSIRNKVFSIADNVVINGNI